MVLSCIESENQTCRYSVVTAAQKKQKEPDMNPGCDESLSYNYYILLFSLTADLPSVREQQDMLAHIS